MLLGKTAGKFTYFLAFRKIENRFKPLLVQWERLLRFPKFLLLYKGGQLGLISRIFKASATRVTFMSPVTMVKNPSLPTCSQLLF